MTRDEADTLNPSDHVRLVNSPLSAGRVIQISPYTVWVQWKSGAVVSYGKDSMPHIEPVTPNNP